MDERYDVVVVGAGLAGLAAAATAAGAGASTLVLDGHHPGGRASTDQRGRYRFNRGPHALYQGGEATAVLARLGVTAAGAAPPAAGGGTGAAAAGTSGGGTGPGAAVTSGGGTGPVTVVAGGRQIEAGAVVLAAGTPEADAALLGGRPAGWAGLGPEAEASCLDLGL